MVKAPVSEVKGPDRELECEETLDAYVIQLIDQAVASGWTASEVFDALEGVIRNRRLSYADASDAPSEIVKVDNLDGATANL